MSKKIDEGLSYKQVTNEFKKQAINLASLTLTNRQLCDLELILNGAFEPLNSFMNKKKDRFKSYGSALKRMNLIFNPLNEEYNEGKSIPMYEFKEFDEQEKFVLNVPDEEGDEEVDMDLDMDMGGEDEEIDMDMEDDMGDGGRLKIFLTVYIESSNMLINSHKNRH